MLLDKLTRFTAQATRYRHMFISQQLYTVTRKSILAV